MPLGPEDIQKLIAISGRKSVLTDPVQLLGYENDGLSFHRYSPDAVVIPDSSDEIRQLVDAMKTMDAPYIFRGAGTSLSGGPTPLAGGVIIHVSRLNAILEINNDDLYCVVEPGVVLNDLNAELKKHGLCYPPDPSSGSACTLGGNVAENAGGLRCFKYGVTANYVLGVEAILTTGDVVQFGGPAGGMGPGGHIDWRALMVGSEGMLAAFTKIWLRVRPLNEKAWTFLACYREIDHASAAIYDLTLGIPTPVALEFLDHNLVSLVENSPMAVGLEKDCCVVLTEIDGPASVVDQQVDSIDATLKKHGAIRVDKTDIEHERLKLWKARKSGGGLIGQVSPDNMTQDAVLPRHALKDTLNMLYRESAARGVDVYTMFHAGDGNLHPLFLFDSRDPESYRKVEEMGSLLMNHVIAQGGTLSGEHGIGSDKARYIPLILPPEVIDLHKDILEVFNPGNQLNPEKVIPNRSYVGCCAPPAS
jgi:glycolate oxidase